MTKTVERIETIARSQIGYREGRAGGEWNNDQKYSDELPGFDWSDKQAWCATFVCWVFWKAGAYSLIPTPHAGVDQLASGFRAKGRWSAWPAEGAIAFYGTPQDLTHTGIVVGYGENRIRVVEGNTNPIGDRDGKGVYLQRRLRRGEPPGLVVVGYGYPRYPEGIRSADPAYRS